MGIATANGQQVSRSSPIGIKPRAGSTMITSRSVGNGNKQHIFQNDSDWFGFSDAIRRLEF
eukprot:scaffold1972_cov265-Chaetoceros_neogracile.AAC.36